MAGKKTGNYQVGGDKKTRDKVNRSNPRGTKHGGKPRTGPRPGNRPHGL